ncbi:hypothetical protein V8E54_006567 [Elaphomyces granulatus]
MRYFLALVLSLLPLAFGQAPYPSVVTGTIPIAKSSAAEASLTAYAISVENQPAFTSWAGFMATATDLSTDESGAFAVVDNNPVVLAIDFITATETPAWYTEIPGPFQSYVSSVASVAASIIEKAESSGERVEAKVAVMGSLLATMLVVMLLL